jgi:toxin-antitoxin system PIN domain toxin
MTAWLLDVNVLLALAWPNHLAHTVAVAWFAGSRDSAFATCPITESGFVRISLNPRVVSESKSAKAVLGILERFRALPNHVFWAEDLPVPAAIAPFELLAGFRQVTDAYLLALAAAKGGRLVTFDRALADLAPENLKEALLVLA